VNILKDRLKNPSELAGRRVARGLLLRVFDLNNSDQQIRIRKASYLSINQATLVLPIINTEGKKIYIIYFHRKVFSRNSVESDLQMST